jgi:hypothetical protein
LIAIPAPGTTAPEESSTVPFISPVFEFWALARGASKIAPASKNVNPYEPTLERTILNPSYGAGV